MKLLRTTVIAWTAAVLLLAASAVALPGWWSTPDHRAQALLDAGKPAEAAPLFADPLRAGLAWYRAGEFEKAAAAFARVPTAEGCFDAGNAWTMLGTYDKALAAYDRALRFRPGWRDAQENRAIAEIRRRRKETKGGDESGGEQKPDEIVMDGKPGKRQGADDQQTTDGKPDDAALRAEWLRQVQTRPADFLRAKFAAQIQARQPAAEPAP